MSQHWFSVLPGSRAPLCRLYCLPYAGAGHTAYRHWRPLLSDQLELALAKLPGRGDRYKDPRPASIAELADQIADAIASQGPHRFALFGHSMGALTAFEVARRLVQRHGLAPEALFVSGRRAPTAPGSLSKVLQLDDDGFLAHVRAMGGFPDELLAHEEAVAFFLPIIRADFVWVDQHRHQPGPPLPCPIAVFGGTNDGSAPVELLAGWSQETNAGCSTELYEGGHFFLFPHQQAVLARVQQQLGLAAMPA